MEGWPKTPPASFDPDTTVSWDISPIAPFDSGTFTNERQLPDGTWSPWFGHGKVDAFAAVQRALELANNQTVRVNASRTPNLPIPDRDIAGISDRLIVSRRGRIQNIQVTVDIGHSWIGDLVVRLVSPSGVRTTLHNRTGNNISNLVKTFDITSTPQLSNIVGTDISGVWALEVVDLAAEDEGTLKQWGIDATVLEDNTVRLESVPSLRILNDLESIKDSVTVPGLLNISYISIDVDITHTWCKNLNIELSGPNGKTIRLKEQATDSRSNIQTTFSSNNSSELNDFLGEEAQGNWTLSVTDSGLEKCQHTGKFNSWTLTLR